MTKKKAKKMLKLTIHHAKVLLRGVACALSGAFAAAMIFHATWGLWSVASLNGYAAVIRFVLAMVFIAAAVTAIYVLGRGCVSFLERKGTHEHKRTV